MTPTPHDKAQRACQVCGANRAAVLRPAALVRPAVAEIILREAGSWSEEGWIFLDDLQKFRHQYVEELLRAEKGELSDLENEVVESLKEHEILASLPDEQFEPALTLGQRLADRIATSGGSFFGVVTTTRSTSRPSSSSGTSARP